MVDGYGVYFRGDLNEINHRSNSSLNRGYNWFEFHVYLEVNCLLIGLRAYLYFCELVDIGCIHEMMNLNLTKCLEMCVLSLMVHCIIS